MGYKWLFLIVFLFLFLVPASLALNQCNSEITKAVLCGVGDNCLADSCDKAGSIATFASIITYNGASKCEVYSVARSVGMLTGSENRWYCTGWGSNKFILPEFGMVPRLITFLSSLGIPYWLFRRRK